MVQEHKMEIFIKCRDSVVIRARYSGRDAMDPPKLLLLLLLLLIECISLIMLNTDGI